MTDEQALWPTPGEAGSQSGVDAGDGPLMATAQQQRLLSLGTLSAVIAHELRQPLTSLHLSVGSLAHWLQRATEPDDREVAQRALERMKCAVERMTVLVDHLQKGSNAQLSVPAPVNLDDVVAGALQFVGNTLRDHGVEVRVETGRPPPVVLAEPIALEHLVLNLLCNARDALDAHPRARVDVRAWAEDGHAVLEVSDNGPGVPPALRHQIFEPFFTTRPPGEGTGLGLAICREIVRRHQGELELTPGDLGGACFRARLPLATRPLNLKGE